jgi:hypothetical protein
MVANCNSTFLCIRFESPKKADYPFIWLPTASFRGVNAVRLLSKGEKYTLDKIIADGYNTKLSILKC